MFSAGLKNRAYLACLDDSNKRSFRSNYVYGTSWRPENEPVDCLHEKKFSSIQPANTAEDPYIVATLIAMAQWQRQHCQESAQRLTFFANTPCRV